ncbi:MAG: hypothetical protein AAFU64_16075, partial [Bacteroidota bacterium]
MSYFLKKILLLKSSLLIGLFVQAQEIPLTLIKGKVNNFSSPVLQVKYHKNFIDYQIDSLKITEEGNFRGCLELQEPAYLTLGNGNKIMTAYISPGSTLDLELDFTTRALRAQGKDARANRYLVQSHQDERIKPYSWNTGDPA